MAEKKKSKTRRTRVKNLTRKTKELSEEEQKKVKGGGTGRAFWISVNTNPSDPSSK